MIMRSVDFLKHLAVLSAITVGFASDLVNAEDRVECDHRNQLCYIYADHIQEMNWTEASNLCKLKKANLPVILNRGEQINFEIVLKRFGANIDVWTSGKQYSYGEFTWLNGRTYNSGESVVVHHNTYTHVKVTRNLHFTASDPRRHVHSFCQFSVERCSPFRPSETHLANGCLKMNAGKDLPWYQARNECLEADGDLAVLENEDLPILGDWLKNSTHSDFWIGLRNSSFRWFSRGTAGLQDEIKYSKFLSSTDQPSSDGACISIRSPDGVWSLAECGDRKKVVCQRRMTAKPTHSMTSTMTLEPDSDSFITPAPSSNAVLIVGVGVGAVVIIVCIIIIIVVVMKRSGKSPRREPKCGTEAEHSGQSTRGHMTENRQPTTTVDQCQYAEVSMVAKPFENRAASAINPRPDIVYATMDFQNDSGYEQIGSMPVNPNVAQDQALYAEPFAQ